MPNLETAQDAYACIEGADALVILTEWDEYRALDLDRVKSALRTPVIVDLRNIYNPADLAARGLVMSVSAGGRARTYLGTGHVYIRRLKRDVVFAEVQAEPRVVCS